MKKLQTIPYHPQTNGLVERSHQTIMRMIAKLGKDKKADWPGHLAEIVHTYNATHSAMTRYSWHYLMFRQKPMLPVDFYFPAFRNAEAPTREASAKHVDEYVATVHDWLRTALWQAQAQLTTEAQWQKWYYDQKIDTMDLKSGNLVLVKADTFKGKRKIRKGGKKRHVRWCIRSWQTSPPMKWWTNVDGHASSAETGFFSSCQRLAFPCV